MANVVINDENVKRYYNDEGFLHREDGPAVIYPNGRKYWYTNRRLLKDQGSNGEVNYYNDYSGGGLSGMPSQGRPSGHKRWYDHNGRLIWPEL